MSNNDGKKAGAKATQSKAAKEQTMAEIMKKKVGVTKTATVQLDGAIATQIAELRATHAIAVDFDRRHNTPDTAPAIMADIEELIEESHDTEITFTFKSIGSVEYDKLISDPANKPTDEQEKEGAQFNPDTFPAALLAKASVDPEITHEQAKEIFEDESWNGAELSRLFLTALEVNTETGDLPLSRGVSGATANSLLSLISAASGESPTPST